MKLKGASGNGSEVRERGRTVLLRCALDRHCGRGQAWAYRRRRKQDGRG